MDRQWYVYRGYMSSSRCRLHTCHVMSAHATTQHTHQTRRHIKTYAQTPHRGVYLNTILIILVQTPRTSWLDIRALGPYLFLRTITPILILLKIKIKASGLRWSLITNVQGRERKSNINKFVCKWESTRVLCTIIVYRDDERERVKRVKIIISTTNRLFDTLPFFLLAWVFRIL